jgi:hypothetical protein
MAAPYRSGTHVFRDRAQVTGLKLISTNNIAPVDASLKPGEVSIWFDSTAGTIAVRYKAKDAAGAVTSGTLS